MNGLNNSNDDSAECPLCMEPFEVDDLTFFPCTCGYQICRFCWHRIRTDENKLCPACRKEYPENPADFKPLSQEEMIAFKSQKRQRDQQRKQKITENRKHLANVRVVQKNLVFVVGLPPRLADADILKKHEYFGKYGKIHKVVINPSTTYAGVQGPSASAYVTYVHNADALRAIQSVNNIMIDGRLIKTSLGTTKYCSHFMKNQQCPKGDCMYLHELGDPEASFTKEEMHQGKHQEYEKRLHDVLIATSGANSTSGIGSASCANGSVTNGNGNSKPNVSMSSSSSSTASSTSSVSTSTAPSSSGAVQQKEAWPSLSVSPVNSKEAPGGGHNSNGRNKKDKSRNEKTRHDKNNKTNKTKNSSHTHNLSATHKDNFSLESKYNATTAILSSGDAVSTSPKSELNSIGNRSRSERNKDKSLSSRTPVSKDQQHGKKDIAQSPQNRKPLQNLEENIVICSEISDEVASPKRPVLTSQRSISYSSDNSDDHISESGASGKSSPGDFKETPCNNSDAENPKGPIDDSSTAAENAELILNDDVSLSELLPSTNSRTNSISAKTDNNSPTQIDLDNVIDRDISETPEADHETVHQLAIDNAAEASTALSKLSFDDSNSFFSSTPAFQQSILGKNKLEAELRQNQANSAISSQLPDLLNGIDGYQKSANANEWEEAFKNVMMRNNRHVEEQLLHQQHLQQQQQHHHQQVLQQQEEFLRMHELQKRNNLINNIGLSQMNAPHADFPNNFHGTNAVDMNRAQAIMQQQQQHLLLQQPGENLVNHNNLFGGNMSKFFDFHKSQQQLQHQYLNGHTPQSNCNTATADPLRVAAFLENGRVNSQFIDNGLMAPQSQVQKQRLLGMFESMSQNQPANTQLQQQPLQQQSQQNRFSQNSIVDDDLGFDPFIETQKGLAELMENEVVQKQNTGSVGSKIQQQAQKVAHQHLLDNMQRARMPPPGFNHMHTLGFGGASRVQNSSKILPFMNMSTGGATSGSAQVGQQHQIPMASNWNPHMAALHQHQGQVMADTLQHPTLLAQAAAGAHNKGYTSNDWTAMDPAILSFRQFSSFPQQGQMPPHPQQQQDMFLQHLAQQQQQQQNSQGFNNQTQQQLLPGMNMPNNMLNGQQSAQPQVNANVQGMLEFLKNRQFV